MFTRIKNALLSTFLSSEAKLKRKVDKATIVLKALKELELPVTPVLTNLGDFVILERESFVPVLAFRMDELGSSAVLMINKLSNLSVSRNNLINLLKEHFADLDTNEIELALDTEHMVILMGETARKYHENNADTETKEDILLN